MGTDVTRVMVGGAVELAAHPSIEVVATAATGTEAITQLLIDPPEVLVLDAHITDPGARAVSRRVREWAPTTRVLTVGEADDENLYSTLVAGAAGAILRTAEPHDWLAAIHSTARDASALPPRVAQRILHDIDAWAARSGDPLYPPPSLTSTERKVLSDLAAGDSVEQIAVSHDVTAHLVSVHAGFAVGKLHRYVLGAEKIAAYDT